MLPIPDYATVRSGQPNMCIMYSPHKYLCTASSIRMMVALRGNSTSLICSGVISIFPGPPKKKKKKKKKVSNLLKIPEQTSQVMLSMEYITTFSSLLHTRSFWPSASLQVGGLPVLQHIQSFAFPLRHASARITPYVVNVLVAKRLGNVGLS